MAIVTRNLLHPGRLLGKAHTWTREKVGTSREASVSIEVKPDIEAPHL